MKRSVYCRAVRFIDGVLDDLHARDCNAVVEWEACVGENVGCFRPKHCAYKRRRAISNSMRASTIEAEVVLEELLELVGAVMLTELLEEGVHRDVRV